MVNLNLKSPSHHAAGHPNKMHVIADVHYEHGVPGELAPLECVCGWEGRGYEFPAHRKDVGLQTRSTGIIKVEGI